MKKCITGIFFVLIATFATAQTADEKESVMVPVKALFAGMKSGDSALVHSAFTGRVNFVTVYKGKDGKPVLKNDELQDFLNAIGTKHAESWNEPIWDVTIQVDGNFAQVWAKYAFYLEKKFLHCGVDAFNLFKGEDGSWKIFHLADTRRINGCDVPEKVSGQFR